MADDLRWDYTPESILNQGLAFKTVSAGTTTYMSTASILTGIQPKRHGVLSWRHILPNELKSLLELENYDIGYYNAGGRKDRLNDVLRQNQFKSLDELEPPFIYFERDHGGHIPYRGSGFKGTLKDFYREFSKDKSKIRNKYKESIDASANRLNSRIGLLKDKGYLDETLVIFTSDHGELLGEYGLVDHTAPLVSELVYVPTVFIHPKFEPKVFEDRIIRHIDLLPTILKILGESIFKQCEGMDIFSNKITHGLTYSIKPTYYRNKVKYSYEAYGLWDNNGGHIFNRTNALYKLLIVPLLLLGKNWKTHFLRNNILEFPKAIWQYLSNYKKSGQPTIDYEMSKSYIEEIENLPRLVAKQTHIEDETKRRLKELGYL